MIEINAVIAVIALLLIIVGPASGIWSGLKISAVSQRIDTMSDGIEDIRSWLKGMQGEVGENKSDISAIKAVMEDREKRG